VPSARAIHEAAYAVSATYRRGGLDSVELLHDGCGVTRCRSRLASPDVEFKVASLGVAAELLLCIKQTATR
jgi:hypothetical protein